jgi:hypothetical protein
MDVQTVSLAPTRSWKVLDNCTAIQVATLVHEHP